MFILFFIFIYCELQIIGFQFRDCQYIIWNWKEWYNLIVGAISSTDLNFFPYTVFFFFWLRGIYIKLRKTWKAKYWLHNVQNFIYSRCKTFQRIYIILYIQGTQLFKWCTQFCIFNLYSFLLWGQFYLEITESVRFVYLIFKSLKNVHNSLYFTYTVVWCVDILLHRLLRV